MIRCSQLMAFMLLVPLSAALAGELPRSEPGEVGFSAQKFAGLTPRLQKFVDEGKIAGGVALVARHGKVVYFAPFGYRDLAEKSPMTEDTIFAIASMSKPVTCVAVMTLVEKGKLGLDEPVGKYLPELNDLRVLGGAKDDTGKDVATIPAKRPVTVRDLLTHTSGFAYQGFPSSDPRLNQSYARAGIYDPAVKTIADQVARLAKVALAHQPGEKWTYGMSHDVLGRLIEVVSGQTFDTYLEECIFTPLDMHDTSFNVPVSKQNRVAVIYRIGDQKKLVPLPRKYGSQTLFSGGGGLFSTTRDYARFAQMLLGGGTLEGARIINPETISAMTTNQIGDLNAFGMKYGLGFGLMVAPGSEGRRPVLINYFWGGMYSTNFWVDPQHQLVGVIMTQLLPTNQSGVESAFRTAVNAAIEK